MTAPAGTPFADIAVRSGLDAAATAAWPLPEAAFALDARLAAIEHATTSVDLQTYLVADDATGRQVLRALRDAAMRGVRVRLLVDDIYTAGLDPLVAGLASHLNAEVRLFNPFVAGRHSTWQRLIALLSDFHRLDHRMHNSLEAEPSSMLRMQRRRGEGAWPTEARLQVAVRLREPTSLAGLRADRGRAEARQLLGEVHGRLPRR